MLHISSRPMEGEALSQLGGRLRDLPLLLGGAASEKRVAAWLAAEVGEDMHGSPAAAAISATEYLLVPK